MTSAPTSGTKVIALISGTRREVHRQRPTMTRYEPAITISPRAMPSA